MPKNSFVGLFILYRRCHGDSDARRCCSFQGLWCERSPTQTVPNGEFGPALDGIRIELKIYLVKGFCSLQERKKTMTKLLSVLNLFWS
mmetsp:Transcript_20398/g.31067  ORF Transcript_20398/g.31067 Transcript_20398/m.31067 type:complete len:88 (+) Transcript_20398:1936-2199(+)